MESSLILDIEKLQEQLQHSFENIIREKTTDDCSIVIMTKDDSIKRYKDLSNIEKIKILNINIENKFPEKWRIKRYDNILYFLEIDGTLEEVAKHIHVKPKYAKKYIVKLQKLNFIEKEGDLLKRLLKIDNKELIK